MPAEVRRGERALGMRHQDRHPAILARHARDAVRRTIRIGRIRLRDAAFAIDVARRHRDSRLVAGIGEMHAAFAVRDDDRDA